MNPEIVSIDLIDIETINLNLFNNPYSMIYNTPSSQITESTGERFIIHVSIVIDDERNIKNNYEGYEEELETQFTYTYPDFDFISFKIKDIKFKRRQTNIEKFKELFQIR